MTTVIKIATAGQVTPQTLDALERELASATGIGVTGVRLQAGKDVNGLDDPTTDRLTIEFESAPVDATVNATIAAHPVAELPVSGTFAMVANTDYLIAERTIRPGELVVFDVHVFAVLGDASSMQTVYLDAYPLVYRETGGAVKVERPIQDKIGSIPGAEIVTVGTATTARVSFRAKKAGQLTILHSSVDVKEHGQL